MESSTYKVTEWSVTELGFGQRELEARAPLWSSRSDYFIRSTSPNPMMIPLRRLEATGYSSVSVMQILPKKKSKKQLSLWSVCVCLWWGKNQYLVCLDFLRNASIGIWMLLLKIHMQKIGLNGNSPFTVLMLKKRMKAFLEEEPCSIKLSCHPPGHMMPKWFIEKCIAIIAMTIKTHCYKESYIQYPVRPPINPAK